MELLVLLLVSRPILDREPGRSEVREDVLSTLRSQLVGGILSLIIGGKD